MVKKIRIIIVDDHKLIRDLWMQIFRLQENIDVVGQHGDLSEAKENIKLKRPDIVLLDINVKNESGLDAVPEIRKSVPGIRIIAATMHSQLAFAKKMFQLGAKGYVTKNSSYEEMLQAIDDVMAGKIYVCKEIKDLLSDHMLTPETPAEEGLKLLSLREIEILKLIKDGASSKEIANKIHLSARTVEVHRYNILKKLKLHNTAALIGYISNTDILLPG
ncbi:MAG: hypothetical protein RLY16_1731 [Bacteroidota bacterium]|jgi:DNA-binding NarL/FixJ family response regulator